MMKNRYLIFMVLLFAFAKATTLTAQEQLVENLTLEDAIALGISNNKNLQIVSKEAAIAENNVYKGNAGLLPTVNLIGTAQYSNNQNETTIRTFQPQPPIITFDENGVESQTYNAVVQADYLLLGGFAGKYHYKLLQNQSTIAGLQQQATINGTIVGITELFTEIAKLQSREEFLLESIEVTQKRLEKANDRKQFGQATGLDLLRAETDLNKDLSSLDDVTLVKENLIKQLNQLIGKENNTLYRVNVNYIIPALEDSEIVLEQVKSNNPELQLAKQGVEIANNQLGLAESAYLPKVNFFANYGYFRQENEIQQLAEVQNLGVTVGAGVRFNIFNGSKTKRDIASAKMTIEQESLRVLDVEDRLITSTLQELNTLKTLNTQLVREEKNIATSEETFKRTEERYYNGQATNLDLRDTQTALLNAKVTITDIKLKIIESGIRIEGLKGTLFKNNLNN